MTEPAYEYIEARRTLLDALDALESHRDSLVLIGAQSVYLHTGSTGLSVPPMTTNADLALNTDLLADDPEIATLLHAAGFENKQQPGHWGNPQGIALDLRVAPHQSNRGRRRHTPPIWVRIRRPWRALARVWPRP